MANHIRRNKYPDWVMKFHTKGTLVAKRKDRYYLYRVSSHWNSTKKRSQLKTDKFLGRITLEGLIEPKAKRMMNRYDQISVKEYGSSFMLHNISTDILAGLKDHFTEWMEIFVFSCMRLMYQSPIKNVEFHYHTSYISEMISDAHVSPDALGPMLRTIGMDRKAMVDFMKSFMRNDRYLAVDLTHVLSMSENVISATLGHNSMDEFLPQVQLLFLFSLDHDAPAYFRILPGSINSVASLKISMEESGVKNIVLVSDTGFCSRSNLSALDSLGISYIIPLKRNSKLISYDSKMERHFMFQGHPIFYRKYSSSGKIMFTFRNNFLKAEEEKDFLERNKSAKTFEAIRDRMGTISIITNLKVSGEIIYNMLKSRTDIEQSYDTYKNTIHADRTYMRDDQQMQGWTFVNFIALIMHYRIYALLRSKEMLKKYSPEDVIQHMSRIFMLKIGDEWKMSEIPKKSRLLIEGLEIPIMQKSGS